MSDVTQILERVQQRDPKLGEELLPLVYDELRKLAVAKIATQPAGQTLQATALFHEAWLRLERGQTTQWESRKHFYAAAAQVMRHILIERARKKQRTRHGAELVRVDPDDIEIEAPTDDNRLLQINAALDELAALAPDKAEVVKLRFFTKSITAVVVNLKRCPHHHPNIAKVFDAEATEGRLSSRPENCDKNVAASIAAGRPYFVMELQYLSACGAWS